MSAIPKINRNLAMGWSQSRAGIIKVPNRGTFSAYHILDAADESIEYSLIGDEMQYGHSYGKPHLIARRDESQPDRLVCYWTSTQQDAHLWLTDRNLKLEIWTPLVKELTL